VAPEPGSGKQRRRLRRGATNGDAEHARNKIVGSERRGGDRHIPNDQLTTREWLAQWIRSRRNPPPATMRSYSGHIDNYLAPHPGHLRLTALRPHHIRAMFDKIEERNTEIEKALKANPRRTRGSKALPNEGAGVPAHLWSGVPTADQSDLAKGAQRRHGTRLAHHQSGGARRTHETASGQAPRALIWTPPRVSEWRATGAVLSTYALDAGVDIRVVQEMLGHSSSVLTRDTYTSVSERLQQDAAERVSSIIPRAAAAGTAPRGSAR
jgi:hypothetical protein